MNRPMAWLIFAAFSALLVPIAIFLGGWFLAGPYEGDRGIFGMMINMYGDALTGHPGALLSLFAPVLLVALWKAAFQLRRNMSVQPAASRQGQ